MHGFVDTVEDVVFRQDIVDIKSLERVPGSRGFEPRHGDGDAIRAAFPERSSRICAAVKSISRMPLASITSSRGLGVERFTNAQYVGAEIRRVEK